MALSPILGVDIEGLHRQWESLTIIKNVMKNNHQSGIIFGCLMLFPD